MIAVVDIAGKQFRVSPNDTIQVPRLRTAPGESITFKDVLLVGDDATTKIGNPKLTGVVVKATVVDHKKHDKVIIFKKKRRKGYKLRRGHRQDYTVLKINSVE